MWLPWPRVVSLNGMTIGPALSRDALDLAFGNGQLGLVDAWPKGADENEEPTHRAWVPADEKRERHGNRVNVSVT